MNVIRIPTKFSKSIKRLSDKDRLFFIDSLLKIGDDEKIDIPDNSVGDVISLVYGEWMNMESKNGTKPTTNHISELPANISPSESAPRVEYSRVEESIVDDNKIEKYREKANQDSRDVFPYFLYVFLELGWKPGRTDTLETLQGWMRSTMYDAGIKGASDAIQVLKEFYKYWDTRREEKGFKNKNWKTTLLNSPSLPSNKSKYDSK